MEVKDIVKEAVRISEGATLYDALRAMVQEETNTLLVVDENGELAGEVNVADLMDAIVPEHLNGDQIAHYFTDEAAFIEALKDAKEKPVELFMSYDFSAVKMTDDLMAVAATAIAHHRARIPVVDSENRPVGIISRQGLKHIMAQYLDS